MGDLVADSGVFTLLQIQVPGAVEHRITDIFKPLATPAAAERDIGWFTIAVTLLIFVVVAGLLVYTIARFRRKPNDDMHREPPQVYGSNQIELAWTAIPILIVFVLIGVTARVVWSIENASPPPSTLHVKVIGHQWWWEVQYPAYGFTTANEIHVPFSPDGKEATYFELSSADVAHSFWIPQLSGKVDLIPNRLNYMWIDPRESGVYVGNCAEYCGTQHANMLLRLVAEDRRSFQEWAQGQQKTIGPAEESAGRTTFESLSCMNCHVIKGTKAIGKFGPELSHLGSRSTLGAGIMTNTPEHLRAWINDPQQAKPGCLMPSMKLTAAELDGLVSYLESLK
jgi:cytochrome c oxidase subunit II